MSKENVKIETELINKVKKVKQSTGVTITAFIEQAVQEKLNKTK